MRKALHFIKFSKPENLFDGLGVHIIIACFVLGMLNSLLAGAVIKKGYPVYFETVKKVPVTQKSLIQPYIQSIQSELNKVNFQTLGSITVTSAENFLYLEFESKYLYLPGRHELLGASINDMKNLAQALKPFTNKFEFVFVGHTDTKPVTNSRWINHNNWELSARRAARILEVFEGANYKTKHISLMGFGGSRPKVEDYTSSGEFIKENAAKNRRIEIRLYPL